GFGPMPVVLITGASGFVGRALCEGAQAAGYSVRAAVRVPQMGLPASETVEVGDLTAVDDWGPVIDGVDYVVHAAARAHVGSDYAANRALYLDTNARVTRDLVKASSSHGVRRFILLSTV